MIHDAIVALAPMLQPDDVEENVSRHIERLLQPLRDGLTAEANRLASNAPKRTPRKTKSA